MSPQNMSNWCAFTENKKNKCTHWDSRIIFATLPFKGLGSLTCSCIQLHYNQLRKILEFYEECTMNWNALKTLLVDKNQSGCAAHIWDVFDSCCLECLIECDLENECHVCNMWPSLSKLNALKLRKTKKKVNISKSVECSTIKEETESLFIF